MLRKIFSFSLLLLFFVLSVSYAEIEQDKVIHKIVIKGLKRAKYRDVINTIQSMEGSKLDISVVEKDYKNLFGLGYFEEIYISTEDAFDKDKRVLPGMINLVFEFIEKPAIRKIIFRDNKHLPFASILEGIKLKRGDFLDIANIHSDINVITEKYKEKGFSYVSIDYEIYQDEDLKAKNQVDVIFKINEGLEAYIAEIKIEGNNSVSETTLKNKMKTKERKFFGLIKGAFLENSLYQDIENIKNYYRDFGFYFVEIKDPEITKSEIEEKGVKKEIYKIRLVIVEGDKYKFGGINITGNKIFTNDELKANMRLREEQTFNYSKYQDDIFSLRRKYNDSGYVQTIISDELKIDKEKKIISAVINVIESKQSYIEAIYFRGNEKTKTYVLERTVLTEVGEIFNSSKMMDSLIMLYNLGYFSNVNYEIQQGSAPGLLKIIYIVEEQLTAEVKFGLQVPATADVLYGITLFGEVGEKNFVGRGLTVKARVDASASSQGFETSIEDPWFLNYPWSFGGTVRFYHYWVRNVLRKLTEDDRNSYPGKDEDEIRQAYSDAANGNDAYNDNYLNAVGNPMLMGYHYLTWNLQPVMGYRFLRYFNVSGGVSYEPKYYWLPNAYVGKNNPELIYDNYLRSILSSNTLDDNWRHRFRVFSTFTFATTKRNVFPYEGVKFSFTSMFNFIHYDSIILTPKLTFYLKSLDIRFGDWAFRNVLVFNSSFSFVFPGFQYNKNDLRNFGPGPVLYTEDYVTVDGLFSGRGWANAIGGNNEFNIKSGYAKLDFTLEYRIPIHDQIIWLAGFVDFFNLIEGPKVYYRKNNKTYVSYADSWQWWRGDFNNSFNYTNKYVLPNQPKYDPLGIDNWYGSIGFGIELTFPQLPLSFFVVKRFKLNYYSGIQWQSNYSADLAFVLSMVGVSF